MRGSRARRAAAAGGRRWILTGLIFQKLPERWLWRDTVRRRSAAGARWMGRSFKDIFSGIFSGRSISNSTAHPQPEPDLEQAMRR